MAELKCPHCGQAFTVDDTELSAIVTQIRDAEFEKDLTKRVKELESHLTEKHRLELSTKENETKLATKEQYEKEVERLKDLLRAEEQKNTKLVAEVEAAEKNTQIAVLQAVNKVEE